MVQDSIPGGENMNLLFNSDIKNLLLKTEGLMLLFWSALIVDVRMVRLGRWEGGEVGKVGKVGQCWGGKVGGSWFYLRVGDAEWV